jgi:hypothetical protein
MALPPRIEIGLAMDIHPGLGTIYLLGLLVDLLTSQGVGRPAESGS